jgi:membrane protein
MIKKLNNIFHKYIWNIQLSKISNSFYAYLIFWIRVFTLSIEKYFKNSSFLQAAALTFYSILTTLPTLVLLLYLSHFFNLSINIKYFFKEHIPQSLQLISTLHSYTSTLFAKPSHIWIPFVSIAVLCFGGLRLLAGLENALNTIWSIHKKRTLLKKIKNYLLIIIICPTIFITTLFLTLLFRNLIQQEQWIPISNLLLWSVKLIPYLLIWILLCFFYIFLPNQHIGFLPAFIGALIAGSVYQITQWIHLNFQYTSSQFGNIYGVLASLIIALAWIQVSWIIILWGGEIAYSFQHAKDYDFKTWEEHLSLDFKITIALLITNYCIKQKMYNKSNSNIRALSRKLELPISILEPIIMKLIEAEILNYAKPTSKTTLLTFSPTENCEQHTLISLIQTLEKKGDDKIKLLNNTSTLSLLYSIKKIKEESLNSSYNIKISDL